MQHPLKLANVVLDKGENKEWWTALRRKDT